MAPFQALLTHAPFGDMWRENNTVRSSNDAEKVCRLPSPFIHNMASAFSGRGTALSASSLPSAAKAT